MPDTVPPDPGSSPRPSPPAAAGSEVTPRAWPTRRARGWRPAGDRRSRWLTGVLVALVLVDFLGGGLIVWFSNDRSARAQAWFDVAQDLERGVFRSHLRLVEFLEGDDAVDLESEVLQPVREAADDCRVLRDGGVHDGAEVAPFPPLGGGGAVSQVCDDVDAQMQATIDRAAAGADAGEGSVADLAFDRTFDDVLADLDALDRALSSTRLARQLLVERIALLLVLLLVVLLAGIVAVSRLYGRSLTSLGRRNDIVLDAAGEGIYVMDAGGVGVFANPAVGSLLDRGPDELVGVHVHDLVHRSADGSQPHRLDECPLLADLDRDRDREEDTWPRHDRDEFLCAGDTAIPVEYTASVIDEGGAVAGVVLVFRDISERLAVDRMKDEFISVVGHELRTPLTSVHGSLGLLAGGALGDMPVAAQRMLDIAAANTDRLIRLINDILDIERIHAGEIRMQREVVDARDVVREAAASVEASAAEAGIELVVDARAVGVRGDRNRLAQVLVNLLDNAIKFSPTATAVTVTAVRDGDHLEFAVADRGPGIPEERLDEVFGRFVQADSSDVRREGGTGLGLAISKTIVARHQGRIWAENRPEGGAVVRVVLPALPDRLATSPSATTRGPDVVVVDGDEDLAEVLVAILARREVVATHASTATAARDLLVAHRPSVVVIDPLLPDGDGIELLEARWRAGTLVDVPVVVYAQRELTSRDRRRLDHDGVTVLIKARVSPRQLEARVLALLDAVVADRA